MARSNLLPGTGILADPNQAASLFTPGTGPHPIRQKHLFLVRFMRSQNSDNTFLPTDVTFVVKQMDRPSVQPQVEEVNQYNKKRIITTGVKYSPVNLTLYDTADGAAMNMWLDYARYYFGDFNQSEDSNKNFTAWRDDILNAQIDDGTTNPGFGFNIREPDDFTADGINSQFYFDHIRVYQLWGGEYTSFDLINPRINAFTPDDLDYSNSEANTIQMSISYEGIGHHNRGAPVDIFTEASLAELFKTGPYSGETIEVDGPAKQVVFTGSAPGGLNATGTSPLLTLANLIGGIAGTVTGDGAVAGLAREFTNSLGGVLNRFGNFDFGTVDQSLLSNPVLSGIQQAIGGSNPLANIVAQTFSGALSSPTQRALQQVSDNTFSALGNNALQIDGLANSVNIAARNTDSSPMEQANQDDGLSLSSDALNVFNTAQDGTFFLGVNDDTPDF